MTEKHVHGEKKADGSHAASQADSLEEDFLKEHDDGKISLDESDISAEEEPLDEDLDSDFKIEPVADETMEISDKSQPVSADPDAIENVKPFSAEKVFIIAGITILLLAAAVIFLPKIFHSAEPTIEELHELNFQGKLKASEGYIYNAHSFVLFDGLWYTTVSNAARNRQISMPFHFGPRDTEDIPLEGQLNFSMFQNTKNIFVTFNPQDEGLQYIGVAIGEADQVLINAFGKGIIAACTNNQTSPCDKHPIVDCSRKGVPVVYFSIEEENRVLYLDNCIIVSGKDEGLWKATDRMLFQFLNLQ